MKLFQIILVVMALQIELGDYVMLDYKAPTYYSMLENSDLIVRSEIISQTQTTVTLKIEESLKGDFSNETLVIQKFKNWPCASRYDDYEMGQKQINILKLSKEGSYIGMSAGNEGELPIKSGYIYCKSWLNRESDFKCQMGHTSSFRFKLDESLEGLRKLIKLTEIISSKEKNCMLLQIESLSDIESMVIEEQVMNNRLKDTCEAFGNFKFKVINQKLYTH